MLFHRESLKAEAMGLTWYEWWEDRDDDDVKRDDIDYLKELELEQEHLYEDDNDDISVDINDEMSDDTDEFHF